MPGLLKPLMFPGAEMKTLLLALAGLVASATLPGCDAPHDKPYEAGPKGYVAFYVPADDPTYSELHVGAQVYRMEGGRRVFEGSTQKWTHLVPPRQGLTVAVAPGPQVFSIEMAGGRASVSLDVKKDLYYPVRIAAVDVVHSQMIGVSDRVQFAIRATPEAPIAPGAASH